MIPLRPAAAVSLLLMIALSPAGAAGERRRAVDHPSLPPDSVAQAGITVTAVAPPQPVAARGGVIVAWELLVRNGRADTITIATLDAFAGTAPLLSWTPETVGGIVGNIPPADPPRREIAAGDSALFFLWLEARSASIVLPSVTHRLRFDTAAGPVTVDGPAITVRTVQPVSLQAPLAGSGWLAAPGPAAGSILRRYAVVSGGRAWLARRFGVEWTKLDPSGATHAGDPLLNANYFAWGVPVLAVADGVVASVRDGVADNTPPASPGQTSASAAGNYVVVDIGGGAFAVYSHLQSGSIAVAAGAHVVRGQALARVGNSGASAEPRLGFHLCDSNGVLTCNGLPWVLEHFLTADGGRLNEIPVQGDLVDFQ